MEKVSCIYKIQSRTKPECFYIGGTSWLSKRKTRHLSSLKLNSHHNPLLQAHVNAYGIDDLKFEILEFATGKDQLIAREQFYLDTFKPFFNVLTIAKGSGISGGKTSKAKKVIDRNTNVIYHSAKEAADAINIDYERLRNCLRGLVKNSTSLTYL